MNTNISIPFSCTIGDQSPSTTKSWEAHITYLKNYGSHYEMKTQTSYGSIVVLFGKTVLGYFICIPDFQVSCYLSYLKDTFWNTEALTRIIDKISSITIARALFTIADNISEEEYLGIS